MEQYGNTSTYNIEPVIVSNIKRSQYWAGTCLFLESVEEVIDEIYNRWNGEEEKETTGTEVLGASGRRQRAAAAGGGGGRRRASSTQLLLPRTADP